LRLILNRHRNDNCQPDLDIATVESPARILVIQTREDLLIAGEARRVRAS
jgi:acetate kinase